MCIFQLAANSSRLTRPRARRYQGGASPPGTRARRRRPWRRGSACPPAPPRPRPSPRLPRRWWPALPRLDQRFPDGAGALVERRRLEHAHGAVPEDRFRFQDPGAVIEAGGPIDVEDGGAGGDAITRHLLPFRRAGEARRHDGATGQDQLGAGLGEQLLREVLLVALDEGAAHLESDREQERVG